MALKKPPQTPFISGNGDDFGHFIWKPKPTIWKDIDLVSRQTGLKAMNAISKEIGSAIATILISASKAILAGAVGFKALENIMRHAREIERETTDLIKKECSPEDTSAWVRKRTNIPWHD